MNGGVTGLYDTSSFLWERACSRCFWLYQRLASNAWPRATAFLTCAGAVPPM